MVRLHQGVRTAADFQCSIGVFLLLVAEFQHLAGNFLHFAEDFPQLGGEG